MFDLIQHPDFHRTKQETHARTGEDGTLYLFQRSDRGVEAIIIEATDAVDLAFTVMTANLWREN